MAPENIFDLVSVWSCSFGIEKCNKEMHQGIWTKMNASQLVFVHFSSNLARLSNNANVVKLYLVSFCVECHLFNEVKASRCVREA